MIFRFRLTPENRVLYAYFHDYREESCYSQLVDYRLPFQGDKGKYILEPWNSYWIIFETFSGKTTASLTLDCDEVWCDL